MMGRSLLVMNMPPLHVTVICSSMLELRQLGLSMTSGNTNTVCTCIGDFQIRGHAL